ncbi:hypothetical protein Aconfl_21010 [Algoriphagus confluentis]|uniref:Uncharacterized protein n=2 Tax=Algoriphagus confluentis TaxID=1697556 RepID=A0ABQ6PNB5_9BACT|nr:hypothetical protein Aconfl_21010 [Algoriphagus confluentis]
MALLISETGELKEIEVANGFGLYQELVKEASKVSRFQKGSFFQALIFMAILWRYGCLSRSGLVWVDSLKFL